MCGVWQQEQKNTIYFGGTVAKSARKYHRQPPAMSPEGRTGPDRTGWDIYLLFSLRRSMIHVARLGFGQGLHRSVQRCTGLIMLQYVDG